VREQATRTKQGRSQDALLIHHTIEAKREHNSVQKKQSIKAGTMSPTLGLDSQLLTNSSIVEVKYNHLGKVINYVI
jgi:hypothetical protein